MTSAGYFFLLPYKLVGFFLVALVAPSAPWQLLLCGHYKLYFRFICCVFVCSRQGLTVKGADMGGGLGGDDI